MPKLIDNYVLSRKIGAGQYGEVFKGYDRATNNDIAVKSIKRQNVKGKFKELLESQIRVLKSCESPNIIKLYDMKKTTNNYYLIMEFCNDGDLQVYLKKRKYLTEDEAIEILCEVINGFRHLYKHNILHRDLKLANILRNDGVTKIADFGFSKILDEKQLAETMLGSPLNMAPEVLQNLEYTNKADVYSLGVCYYWLLFGRPPYNAKNLNELKSMVLKENFDFPRHINNISQMSKSLIRRMLKANPQERISWQELFKHEVNSYIEKKLQKQLSLTLTMDGNISENVCKLYLNQNLVIIHPAEFKKKEEVVDYVVGVVKKGKKDNGFSGAYLKKDIKEDANFQGLKREEIKDNDKVDNVVTEDQKILSKIQQNTFFLLNERNKIIFLLSVMNQIRARKDKLQGKILGSLVKLSKNLYDKLNTSIAEKINDYGLDYWKQFVGSSSFRNLQHFLVKQTIIVKYEIENSEKLAEDPKQPLPSLVRTFVESLPVFKKEEQFQKNRTEWLHINHLVDAAQLDKLMTKDFDFKHYYCEYGKYEMKQLIIATKKNVKNL